MSINFASPSLRAAGSDLTVAISPLGLVELADEEFEVHGPRLNRYASNWAWYLGHHWAYKREAGEPQLTFNWVKAFADYKIDFQFGQGVQFRTAEAFQAVLPHLYKRVWEVDNDKQAVLYEMGQLGGVSGDVFVKVAYEDPWQDPSGFVNPGRVRILPLNPAFCFPEYHPHDRDRLMRFKLKYRFWGTSLEGTRQVFTYVEILTDDMIEEYVNDELIDQRPNTLGVIPIVHIRNRAISSSPWGLSDVHDIIGLNREFNEKASEISDIINYHTAPVTVITGAKASNLEKGPKKVWGGLPKDASVFNLEGHADIGGALAFLETLKRAMHEITGVPEGALGQMQPASNTSAAALAMMYMPLMRTYNLKKAQYTKGLRAINALIVKHIALKEPDMLMYNPANGPIADDQYAILNPADPAIYDTVVHWPEPLPGDVMVKLQELGMKIQMGLQSRIGALRELGEEMPVDKLREIFEELVEDAKMSGSLDMVRSAIAAATMGVTGIAPTGEPLMQGDAQGGEGAGVSSPAMGIAASPAVQGATQGAMGRMLMEIVTQAFGVQAPERTPENG